jgi:hypothetical protein
MTTARRTITSYERRASSVYGNPAYLLHFSDGSSARTMTNTGWAYAMGRDWVGVPLDVTFTPAGHVRYAVKVGE